MAVAPRIPTIPVRTTETVPVRVVATDDGRDLLDASLVLAQTQLVAQLADETSLDARSMGTLGFSGALLAADLAAKDVLGGLWWTPLIAIAIATSCCLGPVLGIGLGFGSDTDIGPGAVAFYETYGGHRSTPARQQLLADLGAAFERNSSRLKAKRLALRLAVGVLAVGLIAAGTAIEVDRTSTISSHHGKQTEHLRPRA